MKRLTRVIGALCLAASASVVLHAMTSHDLLVSTAYNGDVLCQAWVEASYPAYTTRGVEIWLYGPDDEFLGYTARGEGNSLHYVLGEVRHASVGPGTYHCHVEYSETDDLTSEQETDSKDAYYPYS